MDQLVETVDQRVAGRHRRAGAAQRHLVEHGLFILRQREQLGRRRRLRLGEFLVAEQGAGNHHRRHAADLLADMFPGPSILALDVENLFREIAALHITLQIRFVLRGPSLHADLHGRAHRLCNSCASHSPRQGAQARLSRK
jgi:hypothetical protein